MKRASAGKRQGRPNGNAACLLCAMVAVAAQTAQTSAQSLPQFKVTAEVSVAGGGVPGPGKLVSVRLVYADPATGKPSRQPVRPAGFFRVAGDGQGDCATAVRAYSLNRGMHSGATSLTGSLIVTSNADGTLSFVDPLSNLASANIFELVQLGAPAVMTTIFQGGVASLMPDGGILLTDAGGETRKAETGTDKALTIGTAGPALWAASTDVLAGFDGEGKRLFSIKIAGGIRAVAVLGNDHAASAAPDRLAVLDGAGALRFVSPYDGSDMDATLSIAASLMDGNATAVAAAGDGQTIRLMWPGNSDGVSIDAGFRADGLKVDRLGLFAFAWQGREGLLIDLARGRIADRIALPAEPHEALFSGRSLFLNHKADGGLTLIDTGPLQNRTGKAAVRVYTIDAREAGPTPMAVHDPEKGFVIAMPRGLSSANVYGNGNPTAPITTTPLRGARALTIALLDRSFRPSGPGTFETVGRLPSKGPVELVTLTDDFKTIKCFPVQSSAPLPDKVPVLLVTTPQDATAGKTFTALLRIEADIAGVTSTLDALPLTVRDIQGNSLAVEARRRGDVFAFELKVNSPGQYPVTAELPGFSSPGLIEVRE